MQNPSQYDPRYVQLEAIPLVEERTYTDTEKREALFSAESELDLDTNNGRQLEDDEVTEPSCAPCLSSSPAGVSDAWISTDIPDPRRSITASSGRALVLSCGSVSRGRYSAGAITTA